MENKEAQAVITVELNQYYRHRYGGLYRTLHTGFSTVDKSWQVVYIHIHPFANDVWIRPLAEFTDGRFTHLSENDALAVMRLDSSSLQKEITEAKAASKK